MSIATSATRKGMYSGPPAMAPPGKMYNAAFGERGDQELRQRHIGGAASPASSIDGAASPMPGSGSQSPAMSGDNHSPAAVTEGEEKVVVAKARYEMSRRMYEMCIFVSSAAIILVFIGMLFFVLAFKEEIT
ncbi:hypothetical protein MTO96_007286 [Rhipicephalus appendiculatus]